MLYLFIAHKHRKHNTLSCERSMDWIVVVVHLWLCCRFHWLCCHLAAAAPSCTAKLCAAAAVVHMATRSLFIVCRVVSACSPHCTDGENMALPLAAVKIWRCLGWIYTPLPKKTWFSDHMWTMWKFPPLYCLHSVNMFSGSDVKVAHIWHGCSQVNLSALRQYTSSQVI